MEHPSAFRRPKIDWGLITLYTFLTMFGLLMVSPLVYMISTAFKPTSELFLYPPRFFVINPTLKNFYDLLLITGTSYVPFSRYIFNSILVTLCIVFGAVIISAMAAFPLSKHKDMPFRQPLFGMVILALMFAPQVTQIPQYLIVNSLGLINTYFALIFPFLAYPIGLFLIKQFLDQIPDALLEACKMDGAGEWKTFWVVVMPMLKPAWTTLALFVFIAAWNDPWTSMVYTTTDQMKTIPFALQTISGGVGVVARVGSLAAASLLMIVPTLVVFTITQRMVLETMAHSGIKE